MRIENSFEVRAPIDRVWLYLLDVEKVVPCVPGAEITETLNDRHWKGKVTVKLGPVSLSFTGDVTMEERDDERHRAVMKLSGREQRGKGAASATMTSTLEKVDGRTRVVVAQDVSVSGQAAQFGRGMLQDVSASLMRQFAECLEANLKGEEAPGEPQRAMAAPRELRGGRLMLELVRQSLARFFKRLFGR